MPQGEGELADMGYLRGFVPWIVFAAVSPLGRQWGALGALVAGAGLLAQARRAGVAADAQILEVSTLLYFAALGALAFAAPHSGLRPYTAALSFGWLAVTAWSTIAVRRPFTIGIARRNTPREFWHLPVFLRINTVITAVWAAAFTLTAAALAVCDATGAGTAAAAACQVAGFAAPAAFTARYQTIVQARAAAARG